MSGPGWAGGGWQGPWTLEDRCRRGVGASISRIGAPCGASGPAAVATRARAPGDLAPGQPALRLFPAVPGDATWRAFHRPLAAAATMSCSRRDRAQARDPVELERAQTLVACCWRARRVGTGVGDERTVACARTPPAHDASLMAGPTRHTARPALTRSTFPQRPASARQLPRPPPRPSQAAEAREGNGTRAYGQWAVVWTEARARAGRGRMGGPASLHRPCVSISHRGPRELGCVTGSRPAPRIGMDPHWWHHLPYLFHPKPGAFPARALPPRICLPDPMAGCPSSAGIRSGGAVGATSPRWI